MKTISLMLVLVVLPFLSKGQTDLRKVILNEEKIMPADWVGEIQQKGEWEYVKTVTVRRKNVKDYFLEESGKNWSFEHSDLDILPYNWKIGDVEYSNFSVKYYGENRAIVISAFVPSGDRSIERKEVYKVINLTSEYLILEEVKDTYCFDFSEGRNLTKRACKEKAREEPKRMFGGASISIGRRPPKYRLVFRLKK